MIEALIGCLVALSNSEQNYTKEHIFTSLEKEQGSPKTVCWYDFDLDNNDLVVTQANAEKIQILTLNREQLNKSDFIKNGKDVTEKSWNSAEFVGKLEGFSCDDVPNEKNVPEARIFWSKNNERATLAANSQTTSDGKKKETTGNQGVSSSGNDGVAGFSIGPEEFLLNQIEAIVTARLMFANRNQKKIGPTVTDAELQQFKLNPFPDVCMNLKAESISKANNSSSVNAGGRLTGLVSRINEKASMLKQLARGGGLPGTPGTQEQGTR